MSKEYRYRKHIYWGQYFILIFFVPIFLLMLGPSIYWMWTSSLRSPAIFLVVEAFVFLIAGVVLWYSYYRLAGVTVSIHDDVLIYKTRTGEKRLPLENIYLEFSSIKYMGGWLRINAGRDTIRLTVVLKDISGFLLELKTKLDNKHLSSHYDAHKLFGFLKTAAASDQSWERASVLGKVFLLVLGMGIAILTGFIFGTFPIYGFMLALLWGFLSMVWIVAAYIIAEIILFRAVAVNSNETGFTIPPRDLNHEKLIFDRAFTWGTLGYFALSLFVLIAIVWIRFVI